MTTHTCKTCGIDSGSDRTNCPICGTELPTQSEPSFKDPGSEKYYVVVCYMRVDAAEPDPMPLERATKEMHGEAFVSPEHIYKLEEYDPEVHKPIPEWIGEELPF